MTARRKDARALEDPATLERGDPGGMLGLAAALGGQLLSGYAEGRASAGLPSAVGLRSIVVCGMGGSGIAGDVVRALYAERLSIPVVVTKGHGLPEFCGRDTLVLAASYSGATEETLSAFGVAVSRGCRVVTLSAGGELAERSRGEGAAHVELPGGVPVPRAALGYLAAAPIGVLETMGLVPPAGVDIERTAGLLEGLAEALGPARPTGENEAKSVAAWLDRGVPVVWGSEGTGEAAALRWRTQFNENAKMPAFHSTLPELDHNEVEGWSRGAGEGFALIVLRHPGEHQGTDDRLTATLEAIAPAGLDVRQVAAVGDSPMEWLFSLVMMGDFATTYAALARGVDPLPVPVLTGLKERLRA